MAIATSQVEVGQSRAQPLDTLPAAPVITLFLRMMTTTGAEYDVLRTQVRSIVQKTPVSDIHTHLYDPAFGPLLLWGIDDLLVYHYLVAESFRRFPFPYETFWKLSKQDQAELIWQQLFIHHSPISEACRGVVTTLNAL